MTALLIHGNRPQQELVEPPFHAWELPGGEPWVRFYRREEGYLLRFPDLADFQVAWDGESVGCWPLPEIEERTVHHLFQNQVRPLALSRKGRLVFHASAVAIASGVVVFMGASGRGKSTLAAGFGAHGHPFLADDALELEPRGNGLYALPGEGSIRLWDDSLAAVLDGRGDLAPPVAYSSKSRVLAGCEIEHCVKPLQVRAIYFLGEGTAEAPVILPLQPSEALIELVRHSFLLDIEAKDLLAAHFDELARMVSEPIYHRLDYPRCFADLPWVRRRIIEHACEVDGTA